MTRQPEKQEKSWLAEKINVKKLKFYHGVITREDVQLMMKDAFPGDYLLRAALMKLEVVLRIFLCVKVGECDIHHYVLEFKDEKFVVKQEFNEKEKDGGKTKVTVDSPPFKDYDEMIQYYRVHRLACGQRLNRSIHRPKWHIRSSEIHYDETGKLGAGNFCFVYRGRLKRFGREDDIAIKVSKSTEKEDSAAIMEVRNALFAEAKIMIAYNHMNIIKLFGICCDNPPFMVCMEFCAGGSVESLLMKSGKDMEEFEKQTILIDACRGMRYLAEKKCIHRDLASRNCLITADGLIKIADFGLSKILASNQTAVKEALKEAPLLWLAPECIQKESEFSTKSDVWAFGVLIFEVYSNGQKPFSDENETGAIIKAIRRANMPLLEKKTEVPKMDEMLAEIWTRKPEDRIDFQKVLEHLAEALVPANMSNVKKMQLNKLPGVTRKKMPNTDTDREETENNLELYRESSSDVKIKLDRKKTGKRRAKIRRRSSSPDVAESARGKTKSMMPRSANKEQSSNDT